MPIVILEGASIESATISYDQIGSKGIPLLFLHGGWGYSLYPIDLQIPALLPICKIFIPSRSGYGNSSRISHLEPNFHELAALEMLAFLDACEITKCIAWGHSDGAVIGAWMGLHQPQRLLGVILEAFHFSPRKLKSLDFWSMGATETATLREKTQVILQQEHGNSWREVIRISSEAWLQLTLGPQQEEVDDLFRGHLHSMTVPALLIHSRDDPRTEPLEIENALKQLPNAELHMFDKGGHSPHTHLESSDECTRLIQAFIKKIGYQRSPSIV